MTNFAAEYKIQQNNTRQNAKRRPCRRLAAQTNPNLALQASLQKQGGQGYLNNLNMI